ncbi:hypothetical protein MSAN_02255900 [Mycena sanguinolenta]|uniref:Uncharacterized protein n=1 Tax=Mycena sanguinolenta TaxID=230812 RepID=A0A8H6XA89_9AGAR|nr:hypothetical protein MSAN_02255900 [Mycena sanguinolenta]
MVVVGKKQEQITAPAVAGFPRPRHSARKRVATFSSHHFLSSHLWATHRPEWPSTSTSSARPPPVSDDFEIQLVSEPSIFPREAIQPLKPDARSKLSILGERIEMLCFLNRLVEARAKRAEAEARDFKDTIEQMNSKLLAAEETIMELEAGITTENYTFVFGVFDVFAKMSKTPKTTFLKRQASFC